MQETGNKYVSFGAFLVITITGLGLAMVAAVLLSWVAYLSPWMPSSVWACLWVLSFLGCGIAASSAVASIATMASRQKAAHRCLVAMLFFLAVEIFACAATVMEKEKWTTVVYHNLKAEMEASIRLYDNTTANANMWNEIQHEVSCCGVTGYNDWMSLGYSDGHSVPSSCCLLVSPGCGVDVNDTELINVQGCLPAIGTQLLKTYQWVLTEAVLPLCMVQIFMVAVLVMSYRSSSRKYGGRSVVATVDGDLARLRAGKQYSPLTNVY